MATFRYKKGKQKQLEGSIAILTDDIKLILLDTTLYTVDEDTDEFIDDIPSGAQIARSGSLTGKTSTDGVFDADDATFASVPAGTPGQAVALVKDTGSDATSPVIAYLDNAGGLPVTPNNDDIVYQFDAAGIYAE